MTHLNYVAYAVCLLQWELLKGRVQHNYVSCPRTDGGNIGHSHEVLVRRRLAAFTAVILASGGTTHQCHFVLFHSCSEW
jgi:hypothetical protein